MRALHSALAVALALAAVASVRGQDLASTVTNAAGVATGVATGANIAQDLLAADPALSQAVGAVSNQVPESAATLYSIQAVGPNPTKEATSSPDDVAEAIQELADAAKAMNSATNQMNKAISDAAAVIMEELEGATSASTAARPVQQGAPVVAHYGSKEVQDVATVVGAVEAVNKMANQVNQALDGARLPPIIESIQDKPTPALAHGHLPGGDLLLW